MVGITIWIWHIADMLVVALVDTSDNDKKKQEPIIPIWTKKKSRNLLGWRRPLQVFVLDFPEQDNVVCTFFVFLISYQRQIISCKWNFSVYTASWQNRKKQNTKKEKKNNIPRLIQNFKTSKKISDMHIQSNYYLGNDFQETHDYGYLISPVL